MKLSGYTLHYIAHLNLLSDYNTKSFLMHKNRTKFMVSRGSRLENLTIENAKAEHGAQIHEIIKRAFGVPEDDPCDECIGAEAVAEQVKRFPEGQFVALYQTTSSDILVVGYASTMRTNRPPNNKPKSWMDAIGTLGIANHVPDGDWLYGVEMAVRPKYHRQGIGTQLYDARFELVQRLNLKGWYACGMLMGYHRYADQMSVQEYGEKVIKRELHDPTVTMQMNRGFTPLEVVEDYLDEPLAGGGAVLIIWENPEYNESE